MGKYIGPDNTYGLFEKQSITVDTNTPNYDLLYRVPSANALLVVSLGAVLEPGVDYTIINGGKTLSLDNGILVQLATNTEVVDNIYVVYLGKQLSVTNSRVLIQASAEDLTENNKLETNHALSAGRVQVFKNGTLLSLVTGYTIEGTQIVLIDALSTSDKLDVYVNVI